MVFFRMTIEKEVNQDDVWFAMPFDSEQEMLEISDAGGEAFGDVDERIQILNREWIYANRLAIESLQESWMRADELCEREGEPHHPRSRWLKACWREAPALSKMEPEACAGHLRSLRRKLEAEPGPFTRPLV